MYFELGGVEFGGPDGRLIVTDFDPGAPDVRSDDIDFPGGDGLIPVVDRLGGTVWTWTIRTNVKSFTEARRLSERLNRAWRPSLGVGESAWLLYGTDGLLDRAVRVRPRRFAGPSGAVLDQHGVATIECDAVLTDPRMFSFWEREVSVGLSASSAANLKFPTAPPFVWTSAGEPRHGSFIVRGEAPSSPVIEITGPINQARVEIADFAIQTAASLKADQTLRVDALDRRVTITTGAGQPISAPGALHPSTRLANIRLDPGEHTVTFTGQDVTGAARCRVAWRDAWRNL